MALGNPVPSDYPALFRNYLKRATRSALQPPTPQDTFPQTGGYERTSQLIHTLTYALQSPDMWVEAKELLFSLSETLERTARHTDLITLLEAGLRQSETVADGDTHAILQIRLALLILTQAEGDRAHTLLTNAYTYFQAQSDNLRQGEALNGLARWAIQRGEFGEATALTQKAIALIPADAVNECGISHRLLGAIATDRLAWDDAYASYQKSLQLWQLGNNPRFIGSGWANVGSALRGLGRYEEAIAAFREGIQRFETAQDLVNRALVQMNLGNLYLHRKQYQEAIEQYYAAETVFRQLNRVSDLARLYNNWGMAYSGLEWWEQAIRAYEQSIGYWDTLQNPHMKANALDNLGLAFFGMKRYAESAATYRSGLIELDQMDGSHDPNLREMLNEHLAETIRYLHP
jgi:tetratricopeptide (TPR) repeat protein